MGNYTSGLVKDRCAPCLLNPANWTDWALLVWEIPENQWVIEGLCGFIPAGEFWKKIQTACK